MVAAVRVWRDNGSTVFDIGDTQIAEFTSFTLTAGEQTFELPDDQADADFALVDTPMFFVELELTANATLTHSAIGLTHIAESGSAVESDSVDIALLGRFGAEQSTTFSIDLGNAAPSTTVDGLTVDEGGTHTVDVLFNDSDAEDGSLLYANVSIDSGASNGVAAVGASDISYTHDGTETTSDSFDYEVCDSAGACSVETVNVTVTPINDDPTIASTIVDFTGAAPSTAFGPLNFQVDDAEDGAAAVLATVTSSDQTVIPTGSSHSAAAASTAPSSGSLGPAKARPPSRSPRRTAIWQLPSTRST